MTTSGRIGTSWTNKPGVNRVLTFLAAGCGFGHVPLAPGTVGSLPGILLAVLFGSFSAPIQVGAFVLFTLVAIGLADRAERASRIEDPRFVVIDEIAGMWASLLLLWRLDWPVLVIAFALFRAFDVWKFFPLNVFEGFRGGVGIVADDLAAGMLVNLLVRVLLVTGWLP
jgi:phosphatidylglycerophosphatase A